MFAVSGLATELLAHENSQSGTHFVYAQLCVYFVHEEKTL